MTELSALLRPHPFSEREVLDTLALQRLAWTYCHAVDRRDYVLLRSLYYDDAIDDHGQMFTGGPDEFIAWLPKMLANWEATSHVIANMLFLIDGCQAEGELVATAYHRRVGGDHEVIAHGRYLDRYEKRDGIWRFLHRSLVQDWLEERSVSAGVDRPDDGIARGQASAADPCLIRLPYFGAQRSVP